MCYSAGGVTPAAADGTHESSRPASRVTGYRLYVLIVDVDDTAEHRAWIGHLKSHLLRRFRQLEMYVTSYPIEIH